MKARKGDLALINTPRTLTSANFETQSADCWVYCVVAKSSRDGMVHELVKLNDGRSKQFVASAADVELGAAPRTKVDSTRDTYYVREADTMRMVALQRAIEERFGIQTAYRYGWGFATKEEALSFAKQYRIN